MTTSARRLRPSALVWAMRVAVLTTLTISAMSTNCAPPPEPRLPLEMTPIGTVANVSRTSVEPDDGTRTTTPNSGTPSARAEGEGPCSGSNFVALNDVLPSCVTTGTVPKPRDLSSALRDKLELRVTAARPLVAPGGRVDLTLTMKNNSSEPLPLYFSFSGEPAPNFEVEAVDAKDKRVDYPSTKPPKEPAFSSGDSKVARVTLAPGGTAHVKLAWQAVKTRWAPEALKRGWTGRGYPRAPSTPLAPGRVTLRVVVPLLGALERSEFPKVSVDVGR